MVSQKISMTKCYESSEEVAQFVFEMLPSFAYDSPLTMTITPVRYEDYYALTVTGVLSDVIVGNLGAQGFYGTPHST